MHTYYLNTHIILFDIYTFVLHFEIYAFIILLYYDTI